MSAALLQLLALLQLEFLATQGFVKLSGMQARIFFFYLFLLFFVVGIFFPDFAGIPAPNRRWPNRWGFRRESKRCPVSSWSADSKTWAPADLATSGSGTDTAVFSDFAVIPALERRWI